MVRFVRGDRKLWWWALGVVVLLLLVLGGAITRWSTGMLTLVAIVVTVYLGVPVMAVALRQWADRSISRDAINGSGADRGPSVPPSWGDNPVTITIAYDGHFVGGDEAAVGLVLGLLEIPEAERRVQVRAAAADDISYRHKRPDDYLRLRDALKVYESGLNLLMRGGARYDQRWRVADLAEAVIELRGLALPEIESREWWFCWPPAEPSKVSNARFTEDDARFVRSGYYRHSRIAGGPEGIVGLPDDEPIWLASIFPSIVWKRVIPAAVLHSVQARPDNPQSVDVTGWVLSDRPPDQLARKVPGRDDV